MSYTTRILLPSLLVSLLTACGGNDNNTSPTRIEGQENLPSLNAGGDQQAAERSNIELRATVQNQDQNSVVGYAWFPASEETVFFGDAGRSDESVFNLQLPQVAANTPVEFVVQAQLSNGTVLEDRVQITIQNTFDNALPVVNTTVMPIQADNRLMASACESTDSDGTIQTYQWRNETLNFQYEETGCNLNVQLPNSPESQTYTLRAIAIDNEEGLGFKLFNVTTPSRPANTAPVIQDASALPEPVRPGENLNLQVNANDADGDSLFYRWTQTAGATLTINNADKAMAQVQIPLDLANQLADSLKTNQVKIGYASSQDTAGKIWAQPVFCLMHKDLLGSLKIFLESGERKIDRWFAQENACSVLFANEKAFTNANTLEELAQLESLTDSY